MAGALPIPLLTPIYQSINQSINQSIKNIPQDTANDISGHHESNIKGQRHKRTLFSAGCPEGMTKRLSWIYYHYWFLSSLIRFSSCMCFSHQLRLFMDELFSSGTLNKWRRNKNHLHLIRNQLMVNGTCCDNFETFLFDDPICLGTWICIDTFIVIKLIFLRYEYLKLMGNSFVKVITEVNSFTKTVNLVNV